MLNYSNIKDLIRDLDSSSLRVFELESNGFKLKLSKNDEVLSKNNEEVKNEIKEISIAKEQEIITKITSEELVVNESFVEDVNFEYIKSPIVGTFYSSATPGGEPYVEVGSKVKKGDVLCIVEAMKIMNEIVAEANGEIIEVLREDEDIVEFGMPIFKIK